jgi:hypothetical protein
MTVLPFEQFLAAGIGGLLGPAPKRIRSGAEQFAFAKDSTSLGEDGGGHPRRRGRAIEGDRPESAPKRAPTASR